MPTMAYDPDAPMQPPDPDGRGSSASRAVSMIGRTIAGNFRITSLIGAGAMGDVYQAQQLSLGKDVALKLLRRELLIDETLRKRFELEAKNASSLNHPNCIQIIDFGRDGDLLFIAMEYLKGSDLCRTMETQWPFPLERTVHIFDQVLAALEEAHEHGIVHRDLKPANVMLVSRRGDPDFVKVCDFGIAKADGTHSSWAEGLTMKGLICGTPEYMSPEQARGERLDGRSDLYAAGVVLYQMLTGEVPFKSSSPVALLSMHLGEMPAPPSLRKPGLDIPARLEELVLRALEKDPAKRPQTAAEFREELRDAVSEVLAYVPALGTGPRSSGVRSSALRATGSSGPNMAAVPTTQTVAPALRKAKTRGLLLTAVAVLAAGAAVLLPSLSQKPSESASTPEPPAAALAPLGQTETIAAQANEAAAPLPEAPPSAPAPAVAAEAPAVAEVVPRKKKGKPPAAPGKPAAVGKAVAESAPLIAAPVAAKAPALVSPPAPNAAEAPQLSASESALQEAQRLLGKGQYQQACQKGEDARKIDPSQAATYKFLGKCYMRAGDTTRATDHYRRYLELAPSAPDAAFIRSIVK